MRRTCNDCHHEKTIKARGLCSGCWARRHADGTLDDAPLARPVPVLDGAVLDYLKLAAQGATRRQAAELMGIGVADLERILADQQRADGIRGATSALSPHALRITPSPGYTSPLAACRTAEDRNLFHGRDNEHGPKAGREKRAKAVCRRCPIRVACLAWALETREPAGVWGGMTAEERVAELKRLGGGKKPMEAAA